MTRIRVEASAVLDAPPAQVYAVLADYRNEHPHILPREYFPELRVESGGRGEGTRFFTRVRVMGMQRRYHMRVSEPEPGRVLRESDLDSSLVTTFTLTPLENGRQTQLYITTEWDAVPGLAGLIERWGNPPVMRRIYAQQLRHMAAYMRKRASQSDSPRSTASAAQ
jgi:hypothetical protein